MANKSVLELAVGTGQWDAGLKKARQSLDNFTQANGGLQQALGKDSASMQKFVQMMGQMDSTAKTAKGQMNDYKSTIEQLTMQYNRLTDAQKKSIGQDYLNAIEQLKQKYHAVNEEMQNINHSLQQTNELGSKVSGGFLSGDKLSGMLQVFGGNVMTKAAGMAAQFGTELVSCVQQGVELARQGEGIRVAFERLGRGDILQGLRDATHGTVTDLELMKAAVKFNDFKLPLDQLGTLLAFAQQKAKDTGQSVDYMVDSIVTGLGRKSLMILDNLGLSAAQVKERMAETGDMTKAVADIIKEEMSKSGDYIETAADRATRAEVDVQNAMENLGRTLLPLQEQGTQMWQSLQVGALNLLNEGLTPLVPKIVELKSDISELYDTVSNNSVFNGLVNWMETGIDVSSRWIPKLKIIRSLLDFGKGNAAASGAGIGGIIANIPDQTINEIPEVVVNGTKPKKTTRRSGGSRRQSLRDSLLDSFNKNTSKFDAASLMDTTTSGPSDIFRLLQQQHQQELRNIKLDSRADFEAGRDRAREHIENMEDPMKYAKKQLATMDAIAGNIGNITSGLAKMGIELPEGITAMVEGIQTVISIISSIMTLVTLISTIQSVKSIPIIGWALANGGIVGGARGRRPIHAAMGTVVPGNKYSGDQVPAMLNSGEVVLNRSQVSTLASTLQGTGLQNMNLQAIVTGEQLRFILNTNSRRRGKGEYVTSTHQ